MEILFVTAELEPLAGVSDAASAVASLAKALRQLGHEVTVAMPRYRETERSSLLLARRLTPLVLPQGGEVTVYDGQLASGVRLALFEAPALFDRPGIYGEHDKPFADNAKRFGLLSQAAVALVRQREAQGGAFDLLHLHDWPGALVPLVLRRAPGPDVPTILTVHDVRQQGVFPLRDLELLGLGRDVDADEGVKLGTRVSVLKGGLLSACIVTTVSPAYAQEMRSEALSGPLAAVVSEMSRPIVGIINGIDYATCNPATDPLIVSRFHAEDCANKGLSKSALIREFGLELDPDRPLVACIGTATRDGGLDLLAAALPAVLKNALTMVVALRRTSQGPLVDRLEAALAPYPERCALVREASEAMEHRLLAAADLLVVPARHVPCGSLQLMGQRYGAVPVVSASGGHLDTVVDCDAGLATGTGFVFDELSPNGLAQAIERGLVAMRDPGWAHLRRRVMRLDLGWDRPARRYLQVYRHAIGARA
ncbi:MAG: glycogen synthase [Polyangiaceae bacterium]|nr:glycogen synthase [Polyangiaceae bacterium]